MIDLDSFCRYVLSIVFICKTYGGCFLFYEKVTDIEDLYIFQGILVNRMRISTNIYKATDYELEISAIFFVIYVAYDGV